MEKTSLKHIQAPETAAQRKQPAFGPWYRNAAKSVITPEQEAEARHESEAATSD